MTRPPTPAERQAAMERDEPVLKIIRQVMHDYPRLTEIRMINDPDGRVEVELVWGKGEWAHGVGNVGPVVHA